MSTIKNSKRNKRNKKNIQPTYNICYLKAKNDSNCCNIYDIDNSNEQYSKDMKPILSAYFDYIPFLKKNVISNNDLIENKQENKHENKHEYNILKDGECHLNEFKEDLKIYINCYVNKIIIEMENDRIRNAKKEGLTSHSFIVQKIIIEETRKVSSFEYLRINLLFEIDISNLSELKLKHTYTGNFFLDVYKVKHLDDDLLNPSNVELTKVTKIPLSKYENIIQLIKFIISNKIIDNEVSIKYNELGNSNNLFQNTQSDMFIFNKFKQDNAKFFKSNNINMD